MSEKEGLADAFVFTSSLAGQYLNQAPPISLWNRLSKAGF